VILTARLVLPISGPPLPNGGLVIRDGLIRAIGPTAALHRDFPGEPCEALGDAVLLPGLVNAHTHLELTGLQGRLPLGRSWSEWLLALLSLRLGLDRAFYTASSREGAAASLRSGVTCVADITASGASLASLKALGLRGIVFQEVLGPDPEQAEERLSSAETALRALQAEATGSLLSVGLSPHAPYSVSEALLERCADLLRRTQLRATMHLAESPDEVTYIGLGLGPLATDLLPAVGRRAPAHRVCGESPTALLARVGLLSEQILAAHAVQVGSSDLELLKEHAVALALCPRSNHHLRVGSAPLPRYLAARLRVGLGTDSLASNETLSLWDEMRFALTAYGETVTPKQLLTMATLGGAAALGMADEIGSLEPGKRADLIGVALDRLDDDDPCGSLLRHASEKSVILTMVDGKILYRG
jgi:5-methylthioadenosine/S-adenosylhomocysteine deaminase